MVLVGRILVLSDRPARIAADFRNDRPNPRHRDDPDVVEFRREILAPRQRLTPERTMSNLRDYLVQKRDALAARKRRIESGALGAQPLAARVIAEGRSGVRRIRVRDHQVITDSPDDFAGYDLGPSSPELQLGVLGSCLTHSFLIQAAAHGVPVDALDVEVTGRIDARAGSPGHEATPVFPHEIAYTVHITSLASEAEIATLTAAVDRACPILNLLRGPQRIEGRVERHAAGSHETAQAA